jgi:hypothetical protein
MTLAVRLYKNRTLAPPTAEMISRAEEGQQFWGEAAGALVRVPELDARYKGYAAWKLAEINEMANIVPCKALAVCVLDGAPPSGYVLETAALPVSEPQVAGMFVAMTLSGAPPPRLPLQQLPQTVWRQLGRAGDAVVYLLRLKKDGAFDPVIARDDVTGEGYPYVLSEIYCLRRN